MDSSMLLEASREVSSFQAAKFLSSVILKEVPISKRHLDMFGGNSYWPRSKRTTALRTDRYKVNFLKSFDGMSQRERLQAELDYIKALREIRKCYTTAQYNAHYELAIGGKQIEFEERFDLAREIQKLKSISLPKTAQELFHGRGIHLPSNHQSLNPHLWNRYRIKENSNCENYSRLKRLPQLAKTNHLNKQPTGRLKISSLSQDNSLDDAPKLEKYPRLPAICGRMIVGN